MTGGVAGLGYAVNVVGALDTVPPAVVTMMAVVPLLGTVTVIEVAVFAVMVALTVPNLTVAFARFVPVITTSVPTQSAVGKVVTVGGGGTIIEKV